MLGDTQRCLIIEHIRDKNMNNIKVANLLLEYINLLDLYKVRKRLQNDK